MQKILISLAALVSLSGCDVLFPEDPRLGAEGPDACAKRIDKALAVKLGQAPGGEERIWLPTYTYDITKLGFEEIQSLIVTGSDETAGSRGMLSTNETETAVAQFMQQSVDENGSFFLGRDPALYRVRGAPTPFANVIAAGCERQLVNMRLIDIDIAPSSAANEQPGPSEAETTERP